MIRLSSRALVAVLAIPIVLYLVLALGFLSRSLPEPVLPVKKFSPNNKHLERPNGDTSLLANATFVVLCRNSDLGDVLWSVQQMEDRFNRRFGYPWVFLNDEPFTEEFQERVSALTDATVSFGTIPREHWVQPEWIDEDRAQEARRQMGMDRAHFIPYGGSLEYRNMCRFNSGFFFLHDLLKPYKYYWRVEPGVRFFCDLDYDPFTFMEHNNKTYGFNIGIYEYKFTILTLWDTVKEFMRENPELVPENNMMGFISDDAGETYNLCHFWSNFEIGDMDFWRGDTYTRFFDFLDKKGGFYYERWGDAPVHSIAASIFLRKEQTQFFSDIGYRHEPFQICPQGEDWTKRRCSCDPTMNIDKSMSCIPRWEGL
ncbi:glycosyltransferase family 15 protein [Lactarius hengduanensis]|nr:glycosyltransferase family 15 protein [Lactarius hengduanensis]